MMGIFKDWGLLIEDLPVGELWALDPMSSQHSQELVRGQVRMRNQSSAEKGAAWYGNRYETGSVKVTGCVTLGSHLTSLCLGFLVCKMRVIILMVLNLLGLL